MTREQFLQDLRAALRGLPPREIDEICADYNEYFYDAAAAGRQEQDVAKALGNPRLLARELRAEARMKSWEANRSPRNFVQMLFALAGLGFLNLLLVGPIIGLLVTLFAFFVLAFALVVLGAALVLTGVPGLNLGEFVSVDIGGMALSEPVAAGLAGLAVMCVGLVWFAFDVWLSKWLGTGLVRYARLNFRLLRGQA